MVHAIADIDVPPAMPGVDQAPASATVVIRVVSVPEPTVDADVVKAVDAEMADAAMAEEVAATKTANGEPVTTKAVTTEAMASETMAAATVTTTSVAPAAGVGDLGQGDDPSDKHGKHQIKQLTIHDTLLCRPFAGVFLPSPYTCSNDGEAAAASVVFIAVNLPPRPPALGSRHDGVTGIAAFDHERIRALPDQPPRRRDLDAQRRPALDAWARLIVLRQGRPGNPGNRKGEHRKPGQRYAHGFSPV
jgi:hypothetical protein